MREIREDCPLFFLFRKGHTLRYTKRGECDNGTQHRRKEKCVFYYGRTLNPLNSQNCFHWKIDGKLVLGVVNPANGAFLEFREFSKEEV